MLRVGFSGVPGSGKTSTCRAVASFARTIQDINNVELVSEYARRQVAKYGPIIDINQQFRILKKQLEWEDSVGTCDLVLTDAPIFLGFMYATQIHNKTQYDKDYYFYHDLFKEMSKLNSPRRYDIIFHLPPVIKPVKDGVRGEHEFNQEWRDKSDMFLRVIMSDMFPPKHFVLVEQDTLEDRMKFCLEYIQKIKKDG